MTDYEIGILVGALITWPIVSIGMGVIIGIFVSGRK